MKAIGTCIIIKIVERNMADKNRKTIRLEEKMRVLRNLIDDKRLSAEKVIELQIEYCYLQRQHKLINNNKRGET